MPLTPSTPPRCALDTAVRDMREEHCRAKDMVGAALPLTAADATPRYQGRERSAAPSAPPTKPMKGEEQRAINAINTAAVKEEGRCDFNAPIAAAQHGEAALPLTAADAALPHQGRERSATP